MCTGCRVQVFMGFDGTPPLGALEDTLAHASLVSAHPALYQLLKRRLFPGFARYRRNWQALYDFYSGAARSRRHSYSHTAGPGISGRAVVRARASPSAMHA